MLTNWSGQRDSNPRPPAPKAGALPDCAIPRYINTCNSQGERHNTQFHSLPSNKPPCDPALFGLRYFMSAKIIDGKAIAEKIQEAIKKQIASDATPSKPGLAVVLVGHDPASEIYVRKKVQACEKVGIVSKENYLPNSTTEAELLNLIKTLNQDHTVHGILIQLPLPSHINTGTIIANLDPQKDVDGFHPYNLGRLAQKPTDSEYLSPYLSPCTPSGIMKLLKYIEINLSGLNATVIGASNIVGRPMSLELLRAGCTVTICQSQTQNLEKFVQQADILVVATGNPELVKGNWIKPGSIAIDVGMNRLANGRLVGDLEFEGAKTRAAWITPVPGGVGPMTVATLLENTLKAYNAKRNTSVTSFRETHS
jgi:methylenetetrahydrofolate dehydrogenase (NADP+)/methenyltetrahydrofolate cyclohydrolase